MIDTLKLLLTWCVLVAAFAYSDQAQAANKTDSLMTWKLFENKASVDLIKPGDGRAGLASGSLITAGLSVGDAIFNHSLKMPVGAAKGAAIAEVATIVGGAAMSQGLGVAIGIGMTSVAIAEVLNDVRCKHFDGVTGCDDGMDPVTKTGYVYRATVGSAVFTGSSAAAVCGSAVGEFNRLNPPQSGSWGSSSRSYSVGGVTETFCGYTWSSVSCGTTGPCGYQNGDGGVGINKTLEQQTECPASVDFENPANSIPAGAATGVDGKCKTGRYNPKTEAQLADKMGSYADNLRKVNALYDAINQGLVVPSSSTITGPASSTGTPTTTTTNTSAGTTTTTKTPSTRYSYTGADITAEDDVTTVTVRPDGSVETTTDSGLPPVEQPKTDCEKFPSDLGCLDVGTPPEGKPEWSEKTVTFTPENLELGSECPAPYTFNVRSWEMKLDYQQACNIAPTIRAGVLALTALGCMLWMFAAVKL